MSILWIPMCGQRIYCRKRNIPSLKCLGWRLQLPWQLKTSRFIGGKWMSKHYCPLVASSSPTTRWQHSIQCFLAMHAAYLIACAKKGKSLARLGIGLSVLLEKIIGNIFLHKLWAICLLEADFNWVNKMMYAKQMIGTALERKLIPGECFSKSGSNCISAVMTKIFIID